MIKKFKKNFLSIADFPRISKKFQKIKKKILFQLNFPYFHSHLLLLIVHNFLFKKNYFLTSVKIHKNKRNCNLLVARKCLQMTETFVAFLTKRGGEKTETRSFGIPEERESVWEVETQRHVFREAKGSGWKGEKRKEGGGWGNVLEDNI